VDRAKGLVTGARDPNWPRTFNFLGRSCHSNQGCAEHPKVAVAIYQDMLSHKEGPDRPSFFSRPFGSVSWRTCHSKNIMISSLVGIIAD
jgi:hypothetical protein